MFKNKLLKPMLLKEVDKPFSDNNYIYELKFDGIRALIYASNKEFKIITRNGTDITSIYPELKNIQKLLHQEKVIFDGEIVAFDNGKPSFHKLQSRNNLKSIAKINKLINEIPVAYIAFDILYYNKSLLNTPLIKRKEYLNKYENTNYFIKSKVYLDGIKLFKKVKKLGLEGIIAKKKDSTYEPGKRVDDWLKIKNWHQEEFYIHGIIFNNYKYSLLLGEYQNNKLYYVGKVSISPKKDILNKILKEKTSKNLFANYKENAIYIKPIHKIKINYLERTKDNILREPFIR